jgi:hypothetical protein
MRSVYFSWFIALPFHLRPRHAAGERADPYPGILQSIWEGIVQVQDRIEGAAFPRNDAGL